MNDAIRKMLAKYNCRGSDEYENALKEIIQQVSLLGLWRSKFYEKAAFYGGSSLRILYGLDRFSEDLDFSLLKPDLELDLSKYHKAIKNELAAFGLKVNVIPKQKNINSAIDSAFIKAGTLLNFIAVEIPFKFRKSLPKNKLIKVKFEVDKNPPTGFETEARFLLQPIAFSVNTFSLPSLFAGKMHAVLCRKWQHRVKGRDWYDLIWFIANNIPLNIKHLENRMKQTDHLDKDVQLTKKNVLELYRERLDHTDFNSAREDIRLFLKHPESLELWNRDFFSDIIEKITIKTNR